MADERRLYRRHDTSLAADVNTGEHVFSATAQNLSTGGVGLLLDRALPDNCPVSLSLYLLEEGVEDATVEPVMVQGHVVWIAATAPRAWEAGVRFLPLQPQQLEHLERFLVRLPSTG